MLFFLGLNQHQKEAGTISFIFVDVVLDSHRFKGRFGSNKTSSLHMFNNALKSSPYETNQLFVNLSTSLAQE